MNISEVAEKVYNVNMPFRRELGATFVRFQEFYESPHFAGKIFSLTEFKDWYTANSKKGKETGKFTYYDDWSGYNIPSHVLTPFQEGKFDPLRSHERMLLDEFSHMRHPFYIIGTFGKKQKALKHEIRHGLFYTQPAYRTRALEIIAGIEPQTREALQSFLQRVGGYNESVWDDEMHAYTADDPAEYDEKKKGKYEGLGFPMSGLECQREQLNALYTEFTARYQAPRAGSSIFLSR